MWISFGAGIYFTGKSQLLKNFSTKEAVYIGNVLGKYSQADDGQISQDINFNIFWDVWDTIKANTEISRVYRKC